MIDILPIAGEWAAYFGALTVLAWRFERTTGTDAFHLVVAYLAGVSLLVSLADQLGLDSLVSLLLAVLTAICVDQAARTVIRHPSPAVVLGILLLVAVALSLFDWFSSNAPLSLVHERTTLRSVAYVAASAVAAWLLAAGHGKYILITRLGLRHRWAAEYWARPLQPTSAATTIAYSCCWIPVLTIPLTTTGLLSGTILRDSAIAIVLARVVAERHPITLVLLAGTIALLRTSAAFLFSSTAASPMIELSVFVALLLWARRRSTRSAWEQQIAR